MGISERIKEIQDEMARTQKNKATEHHLGLLKGKLARLRAQLLNPTSGSGASKGEGFMVSKSGDGRIAMVGFPSVGKSTLLGVLTGTKSEAAAYEFTTLDCIPGVLQYQGARLQLLDLPGIIEGAAEGKGKGRQVVAVAKTADLILLLLDAGKGVEQIGVLERELRAVGIRLNESPPNMSVSTKKNGGIQWTSSTTQTHLTDRMIKGICSDFKIHHAQIVIREDLTVDQFIDVLVGGRAYIPALYVWNKADVLSLRQIEMLSALENTICISCNYGFNTDGHLADVIWSKMSLMRIYTKLRGEEPDFSQALIVREGATVLDACNSIHRGLAHNAKYILVWGRSASHSPQKVSLNHMLADEDIIFIAKKTV